MKKPLNLVEKLKRKVEGYLLMKKPPNLVVQLQRKN